MTTKKMPNPIPLYQLYLTYVYEEVTFPVRDMNRVDENSANTSIVKSEINYQIINVVLLLFLPQAITN